MLFDPEALQNKTRYLDAILSRPSVVEGVIARHISKPFRLRPIPRIWEPGGGASLFVVETDREKYFLKVKHHSVWVESRLESEDAFLRIPSLRNEYDVIRSLNSNWVPHVLFYDEEGPYNFLALEYLESFHDATSMMNTDQLLQAWKELVRSIYGMFCAGYIHTDIHEHNIRFRGSHPIIVDLEEARKLKQQLSFSESLDVVGKNNYGDLGWFPKSNGNHIGRTCLERLRTVFKSLIKQHIPELVRRCNFDCSCDYNLDTLQEPDARIYQSLNLPECHVPGQRPLYDSRLALFTYLLLLLGHRKGAVRHLDIGSCIGMFCFRAVSLPFVVNSAGIEASPQFIQLSRILSFCHDYHDVQFVRTVCGSESLYEQVGSPDIVTMLSVYHHIEDKDRFLEDLRVLNAPYLLSEFATQERYYPQRRNLRFEIDHIKEAAGYPHAYELAHSRDYRRPVILFSRGPLRKTHLFNLRLLATWLGSCMELLSVPLLRFLHRRNRQTGGRKRRPSEYEVFHDDRS
jgi:tRNA A-37 threonylcarbamoyl transferase component Bud32